MRQLTVVAKVLFTTAINGTIKYAEATMNQVERTIGRLEIKLKTNEEYKTKIIREIETRGQEVIDMVKNATEAMINIVNTFCAS
jgi:phosphoribosyl-dephospho-CoA transferase